MLKALIKSLEKKPLGPLNPRILACPPEADKPQTGLYALLAGFSTTHL
jgi:hypothetical protein